jgi:MATE family multidrug resistance protein
MMEGALIGIGIAGVLQTILLESKAARLPSKRAV